MISDSNHRSATIVATKPSETTGTVVLYRLSDSIFCEMMGHEEITKLRQRMCNIQFVIDILSGV